MRRFQELSQDEQMLAVEHFVQHLIECTVNGYVPVCFEAYQPTLDTLFDQTFDIKKLLLDHLENDRPMKVSMLHQASDIAKKSWYVEYGDIVVQPQTIDGDH